MRRYVKLLETVPDGTWRIPAGSRLVARLGTNARVMVRKVVLTEPKSGRFDAFVEVIQKDGTSMGEFLRVSSGVLKGMLIPGKTKGIVIRPKRAPARWSFTGTAITTCLTALRCFALRWCSPHRIVRTW